MTNSPCIQNHRGPVHTFDAQAALDHAPIAFFISAPDGRLVFANPALALMFGYATPDQFLESVADLAVHVYVDPADREGFMRLLEEHGEVVNHECRFRRRDGSEFWGAMHARLVHDQNENCKYFQGFITDITDSMLAREAQQRFESLFHNNPASMALTSLPDRRFVDVNDAFLKTLGYIREEIIGKTSAELGLFLDLDQQKTVAARLQAEGRITDIELRIRAKDGSILDGLFSGEVVASQDRQCFLTVMVNITQRKRAEEALLESEEMQRKLLQTVPDLIIRTDMQGTITFINELAFPGLEHLPGESICGRNLFSFIAEQDLSRAVENARLRYEEHIGPQEYQLRFDDGVIVEAEFNGAVIRDMESKPAGMVYVIRDITERKRARQEREKLEAQLLQAQKMESIGILAGGVAHDFNNLLQAMRGNIELLLLGKATDHPDAIRLNVVTRAMDRAAQLVRQLLFFGRKAGSRRVRVDLNQEMEGVARILERTIPRMISLELQLDPSVWPLFADPVQIEQILLNLTTNAVDAMPEGGRLVLETGNVVLDADFARLHPGSSAGPHVLLSVTDTGHGMDREVLDHIYDPFFTTKEVGKGTGLGLASVYGIVKSHGGYIQCYSEPGLGTTFRVYLPTVELDDVATAQPQPETPPRGGSETILAVDDEQDILDLTREALESLGYAVQCAAAGEEALELYRDNCKSIDLVLLDLNMPGMGGRKCLQELLRFDPEVKVLVTSGYMAGNHGQDALLSGAKGFVGKPYQLRKLATKVREILDKEVPVP